MSTTEKPKTAKTPTKPRKTAEKTTAVKTTAAKTTAAKTKVAVPPTPAVPAHHEIALLAEKYWAERGWQDGAAEQDWLRAEQDLMKLAS
jgi:hypothetical protein